MATEGSKTIFETQIETSEKKSLFFLETATYCNLKISSFLGCHDSWEDESH